MSTGTPETSIIIRAFNEERFLPILLKAIHRQDYQDFEIILVDSGSYDRTAYIARDHGARVLDIESHDFTFGYSLNAGIKTARGRFTAIVSAHTEPTDNQWLGKLVNPLREPEVAMVYGRQHGSPLSRFSETLDFRRLYGGGQERRRLSPPNFFANNANSAVRDDLWEKHPFNEALPGLEDIEWAKYWMERGFHVVYEPGAAIYHIHQESWRQIYRRYYREALAARNIGIRGSRDVPMELLREIKHLGGDLIEAIRSHCLMSRVQEILLFRAHKSVGTSLGLLNGQKIIDPAKRDAIYFDRRCRAVMIHEPNRVSMEEIEIPGIKPGEVLVEVAYEGICDTDLEIFTGTLGYYKNGLADYPIIPGHEFSGWVARVGMNVRDFQRGDPVVVECIQGCGSCEHCLKSNWIACDNRREMGVIGRNGGYCEYVVAPARFVHKIPVYLDMKRAALCEPTAVVLKGLKRIGWALSGAVTKPRCAVVGVGPIGHLCAQVLAFRGFEVSAFDRNPKRLSYFDESTIGTATDLNELTQFDVIIEATGNPQALLSMLKHSKAGTTLLLLGLGCRGFRGKQPCGIQRSAGIAESFASGSPPPAHRSL
jgi:2-desacetyl-2-hydroxyethyl bacteriochlorophyllide A dehydrogenase